MVNRQPIKLCPRHAGKLVTVIIDDACYRILHHGEELAIDPAAIPPPSPVSTCAAKEPADVKHLLITNGHGSSETTH
jgi:hypothetical protein